MKHNVLRRFAALATVVMLIAAMAGCQKDDTPQNHVSTAYSDRDYGFQLEVPAVGEQIAIMHTNMGDITLRLFPEAAPKTVENFITHAQNGYYNGLVFHRVINDFMIQGGDPKGNSTGGESIWGTAFEDEFDQKLLNLRGSLSMANVGANTNGSQFFINQAKPSDTAATYLDSYLENYDTNYAQCEEYYCSYAEQYGTQFTGMYPSVESFAAASGLPAVPALMPQAVRELYKKEGGNFTLDGASRQIGGHTVFGQVIDGMDVVDAIAAVETDDNDKPLTDVILQSVEITTYNG